MYAQECTLKIQKVFCRKSPLVKGLPKRQRTIVERVKNMSDKPMKATKGDERFYFAYRQNRGLDGEAQVWIDKETGVNYLYLAQGYGAGLTPLLDADGKPIVTPVEIES